MTILRTPIPRTTLVTICGLILLAVATLLLAGCTYRHKQFRPLDQSSISAPGYELHFVEADDEGWFWDPEQAGRALASIKRTAGEHDTIVLVFVHGWHHSARCCDSDIEGFKRILANLSGEFARPMYRQARMAIHQQLDGGGTLRVIGLYIGWRGRSLPGFLDYLTFWGRKSAAERVGDGDVQELLLRLKDLYEDCNRPFDDPDDARHRKLFGLVTIGHSFGGQVVLRATAPFLEHLLIEQRGAAGYLRTTQPDPSHLPLTQAVRGFGDLVVLVNPAVEAAAYQRLRALSLQLDYAQSQTPLMLTFSSENDRPRGELFGAGRRVGEFFTGKPHKPDPREDSMERTALGVHPEQVTHSLDADARLRLRKTHLQSTPEPGCEKSRGCAYDWFRWTEPPRDAEPDSLSADQCTPEVVKRIEEWDFASRTVFADVSLTPASAGIPHQPFLVAIAKQNVIDGHNGMFSTPFMEFLTRYIAFAEAKRFFPLLPEGDCRLLGDHH